MQSVSFTQWIVGKEFANSLSNQKEKENQQIKNVELLAQAIDQVQRFVGHNFLGIVQVSSSSTDQDHEYYHSLQMLEVDGECVEHKVMYPSLLVNAKRIIQSIYDDNDLASVCWSARIDFVHQSIIGHGAPSLKCGLERKYTRAIELCGDRFVKGILLLEFAKVNLFYKEIEKCEEAFRLCKQVLGVVVERCGLMGKRTRFQRNDNSQFWVRVSEDRNAFKVEQNEFYDASVKYPENVLLNSDLLWENPKIAEGQEDLIGKEEFNVIEQLSLAFEAQIFDEKSIGEDKEISRTEVLTYFQRVIDQFENKKIRSLNSHWFVLLNVLWNRSIVESRNFASLERSIYQLEALDNFFKLNSFDNFKDVFSSTELFLFYFMKWQSNAGYALQYAEILEKSMMFASALNLYEKLELWEPSLLCYARIGREFHAKTMLEEKIKHLEAKLDTPESLEAIVNLPRFYCMLGDLNQDLSLWEKAWEISNHRYARAARSIGEYFFNLQEYENAKNWLSLSLEINSMYPKYWFQLGYASLQIKDLESSSNAFSKVVSQEPEHGQAWNNLAAVHLHQKNWRLAYIALQQCVRFNRNSWEVWDNFCTCCLRLQEYAEACYAVEMLVSVSGKKKIDLTAIGFLCDSVYENHLLRAYSDPSVVILRDKVDKMLALLSETITLDEKFWKIYIGYYAKIKVIDSLSVDYREKVIEHIFRGHIQRARSLIEGDWDLTISTDRLDEIIAQFHSFGEFADSLTTQNSAFAEKYATSELQCRAVIDRVEKNFKKCPNFEELKASLSKIHSSLKLRSEAVAKKSPEPIKQDFYSSDSSSLWF